MYRSKIFKIVSFEQSVSPLFWKKSQKYIYTNSCQCLRVPNFSLKAKEAPQISNRLNDPDSENTNKWGKLKDIDFLTGLKTDCDTFGAQTEAEYFDEGDIEEEKYISERPLASQKLRDKQYADIIKDLIKKRKIKEAIDVVEVRMIKEDRVKPNAYIYNLLLGACGRVGYTKKAFMLYNDMKRRGFPVMGGTYTALFNACANSPWPLTDGLARAKHLHEIMIEKGHEPNGTTYNAMIKAFGRCGDASTAFFLVDEMISKKMIIRNDTITFLLQTCASDKEAGFRHALLVWRKLIDKKIKPSIFNYNTLLRCIRDCGLGDIETTKDVFNKILSPNTSQKLVLDTKGNLVMLNDSLEENIKISSNETTDPTADAGANQYGIENSSTHLEKDFSHMSTSDEVSSQSGIESSSIHLQNDLSHMSMSDEIFKTTPNKDDSGVVNLTIRELGLVNQSTNKKKHLNTKSELLSKNFKPNLIASIPYLGSLVSLSQVKRPEDRLLLVGGFKGLLENMAENNCKPDIKTFTQLLDCIPGSLAAEQELLSLLSKYELKPDIDFYNMLMKKRSLRCDYEGAKVVLQMMKMQGYRPNVMTYGILAMGCKTKEQCNELIMEMKEKKYAFNVEILGAMLSQACYHNDIGYVLHVMDLCLTENVNPSKLFIAKLDEFKKKCKGLYLENKINDKQWKLFRKFKKENQSWRERVHIEEDPHPWQQYRQTNETEVRNVKDDTRFKAKHASLFKVKTSTKTRLILLQKCGEKTRVVGKRRLKVNAIPSIFSFSKPAILRKPQLARKITPSKTPLITG